MGLRNLAALLLLAAAAAARADGVIDFVIDPATGHGISQPGSYRLTANVVMTSGVSALTITSSDVTIDLNGHTIDGNTQNVSIFGIYSIAARTSIIGPGVVRRYGGSFAINIADASRVSNVTTSECRAGILAGSSAKLDHCIVMGISFAGQCYGIYTGVRSVVRECQVRDHYSTNAVCTGIYADDHSTVDQCTVGPLSSGLSGAAIGINTGNYCIVTGNNVSNCVGGATGNGFGIYADYGGTIRGNNCSDNKGGTTSGSGYGIWSAGFSLIESNICDANIPQGTGDGTGIYVLGPSRIVGNQCTDSDAPNGTGAGIRVINSGNVLVGNHCAQQSGGSAAWGILVSGGGNTLRENTTSQNTTAGIRLAAGGNHVLLNSHDEVTGISDAGGNTLGTGTNANVVF